MLPINFCITRKESRIAPGYVMPSTPFRAAFFALGLAFAMTVLLSVPNPHKIRMALRAQREKPLLPYERVLLASQAQNIEEDVDETPDPVTVLAESKPTATKPIEASSVAAITPATPKVAEVPAQEAPVVAQVMTPTVATPSNPPAEAPGSSETRKPLQVASADPTATLGLAPAEFPKGEAAVPELPTIPPMAISAAKPAAPPVPKELPLAAPPAENDSPLSIPVPDPIQRTSRSMPSETAGAVASLPTEKANPTPDTDRLREFYTSNGAFVHPGELPQTWSFQFEETPLPVVLKLLGKQSGSSIIVDPQVEGNFSGQFTNADPAQVLGMVVKAHRFTVHRRGAYLLIGVRDETSSRNSGR